LVENSVQYALGPDSKLGSTICAEAAVMLPIAKKESKVFFILFMFGSNISQGMLFSEEMLYKYE
jgi:hypothetical protein